MKVRLSNNKMAAVIAIATALTFSACGSDGGGGGSCEGDECGVGGISSSGGVSSSGGGSAGSPTSSSSGKGAGGSSSSGGGGICSYKSTGKQAYCQYVAGCFAINEDCEEKIAGCEKYGQIFVDVNPSAVEESSYGVKCSENGGQKLAGVEFCLHESKQAFCQWPDGCYPVSGSNCESEIRNCKDYGKMFVDVNPLIEDGEGLICADIGGTEISSGGGGGGDYYPSSSSGGGTRPQQCQCLTSAGAVVVILAEYNCVTSMVGNRWVCR